MLKEFTIKNFKSINQEATISMEADVERVSEHPEHITYIRGNALLRVCSMYGPNGGGKSNVLKALSQLRNIVMGDGWLNDDNNACVFSESDISEFTAFFATKNRDIGYRLQFKTSMDSFDAEEDGPRSLFRNRANIIGEEIYVANPDNGQYELFCSRNENGIVSYANQTSGEGIPTRPLGSSLSIISAVRNLFYNENENDEDYDEYGVLFELFNEIRRITPISNMRGPRLVTSLYAQTVEKYKEELIALLGAADIHVSGIEVEKNTDRRARIYFLRNAQDGSGQKAIELSNESMGTQKLFEMLVTFLRGRGADAIFLGDDLNAYLHPKLLSAFIELFNNNVNGRSQLIFNSHDIVNMNNRLFRRDEIWFVYRDEGYQTSIVPLSNITNYKGKQIRNDASYGKQYLEGKYGADPFIEIGLSWNE
ncbi:MAG: ATP-binding protein [Bacilli bacterium]|nr:ATP-binding protein [Bacilli bacterium]